MSNPFKEILDYYEVPIVLKQKVLNDIKRIKHSINVADLFCLKYSKQFVSFLSENTSKKG